MKKEILMAAFVSFLMLPIGAQVKKATTAKKAPTTQVKKAVKSTYKKKVPMKGVLEFTGIVNGERTTMHSLAVESFDKKQILTFAINDQTNRKYSNGMLDGNICVVHYKKAKEGYLIALAFSTLKGYTDAVGCWTMPDPLDSQKRMGIEVQVRGQAKSINMATLPYSSWTLGDKENLIILYGKSIGNGTTLNVESKGVISKKNGKLIMTLNDGVVYTKE
ncbi:MAG: lipocalin family protein [Bacteroidaceae bacterium]